MPTLAQFTSHPTLIAVLHLAPLPGSPRSDRDLELVYSRALKEADLYRRAGVDAILIENHGDAPFPKDQSPPWVVGAMAVVVDRIRRETSLPIGVNVLRNDGLAALGIAASGGGCFMRVNVLTGVAATDQGLIEGCAAAVLRARKAIDPGVAILADLAVKYSTPLYAPQLEIAARSTIERALADGLIITGTATGAPVDESDLTVVRTAVPKTPLYVGSGATCDSVRRLLRHADGVIVGSDLKAGGDVEAPVCPDRLRRFVDAFRQGPAPE